MTLRATVLGASVWGPGLEGWEASRATLAGEAAWRPAPSPPPAPAVLPPTERRRTGPVVRLALTVAQEAVARSGLPPAALRSVFASSNGDGPVVGGILEALAAAAAGERVVSPTQFHNSVHNAACGYWSIATRTALPASCIGCGDDTWAAGLVAALAERAAASAPVLLCCYDHPLPPPLDAARPTGPAFAAALVLGDGSGPVLSAAYDATAAGPPPDTDFPDLARNPAARALPLLRALARAEAGSHDLPYLEGRLRLDLSP